MYIAKQLCWCVYVCVYVTGPVKIDHLSAKKSPIVLLLLYHNFLTIYTTTTKSLSLLQNVMSSSAVYRIGILCYDRKILVKYNLV